MYVGGYECVWKCVRVLARTCARSCVRGQDAGDTDGALALVSNGRQRTAMTAQVRVERDGEVRKK